MKSDIHPVAYDCKVTCTCWAAFTVLSTIPELKVEICSHCHQFYTWKKKEETKTSRIAKFRERQEIASKEEAKQTTKRKLVA